MIIAASIALILLALLTLFQIALIAGAPLGTFAWGGQQRVLPAKMRAGSVVAVFLYTFFAALAASHSGIANIINNPSFVAISLWIVAAYMTLGVLMNAISRSKPERFTMTPVAFTLAICFFVLATN